MIRHKLTAAQLARILNAPHNHIGWSRLRAEALAGQCDTRVLMLADLQVGTIHQSQWSRYSSTLRSFRVQMSKLREDGHRIGYTRGEYYLYD